MMAYFTDEYIASSGLCVLIWVNNWHKSTVAWPQQSKTKPCAYCMEYTAGAPFTDMVLNFNPSMDE